MCVVCISCFNVIAISIYMGFCIKLFVNANHTIIQSSIPSFELVIKTGNGDLPWNRYDFSHSHISFKFELSWLHTEMAQPQIVIYCFFSRSNHFQTTMNQCNECNACNACVTCECMYENLPQQEKKNHEMFTIHISSHCHISCVCVFEVAFISCALSLDSTEYGTISKMYALIVKIVRSNSCRQAQSEHFTKMKNPVYMWMGYLYALSVHGPLYIFQQFVCSACHWN